MPAPLGIIGSGAIGGTLVRLAVAAGLDVTVSNSAAPSPSRHVSTSSDHAPAQTSLAWILSKGPDIAPIPGTRHVWRVEENTAAGSVELNLD